MARMKGRLQEPSEADSSLSCPEGLPDIIGMSFGLFIIMLYNGIDF